MIPLVVDVSALLGMVLADEDNTYADAVLEAVDNSHAYVPMLFWFEIRNALVVNKRWNRLTRDQATEFLADLATLPFEVDHQPHEATVLAFARKHTLTVYDASYLELAHRKGLKLATNDRALKDAAPLEGVTRWMP